MPICQKLKDKLVISICILQVSTRDTQAYLYDQSHREFQQIDKKSHQDQEFIPHRRQPIQDIIPGSHGLTGKVENAHKRMGNHHEPTHDIL